MACVCLMHMLIYEQDRCLLMILCVYLTPAPTNGCWCRGSAADWVLGLPCSSLQAWYLGLFSGNWGMGETALAVHLFLVFLSCSCYLVTYPAAVSMEWLGFGSEKFIYDPCKLSWSTARPDFSWWHTELCVCCAACTLLCEQPSYVCVHMLGIWLVSWPRVDQLGSFGHILSNSIWFFNLPNGYATWHNFYLLWLCAGSKVMIQWSWRSSSTRLNEV